ncbi:MAG TPA: CBS domain-containing protein [Polyangiaceae bacterium]|jgi:CBS domain-containing protein
MTHLPIHARAHLDADSKVTETAFVRCPEDGRWTPVEACRRCEKCAGVGDGSVQCWPARASGRSRALDRASITEVLDASVLCVEADARVEATRDAMAERGAPIAVVVDRSGHAVGVCSRADLADRPPLRRVATCMTPFVVTLLDSTTVADALDLVLERELNHVPVLGEGRVVGIVTPRALLRWLAGRLRAPAR